jgi:lysophosphatidate acyltransferase
LLPFKKGAFHLALQAGVPIVPVVVQNYAHVLHLQDRTFEPGTIKVKVCCIIAASGGRAALASLLTES